MIRAGSAERGEPRPGAARSALWASVRHSCRHSQIHLRARAGATPYFYLSSELLRSLPHTDETKVPRPAARVEYGCAHSLPIVPDSHVESALTIGDFSFDDLRLGMLERVGQGLAGDEEPLLAHDRMQVP